MDNTWKPDFNELSPQIARNIIQTASGGIPPEVGFLYFTAGLDKYMRIIHEEYLSTYIKEGGNSFKLIVAPYGNGKTHFLFYVRELAWKENYIVSYITLSPEETPLHKLELVYKTIVSKLTYPMDDSELLQGYEKGLEALLRKWYGDLCQKYATNKDEEEMREAIEKYIKSIPNFESISFTRAVKNAMLSLNNDDEEKFTEILQWLTGEDVSKTEAKKFGIFEKINKTTAFKMIRSLTELIREMGYSGLIVLMDEAEATSSLSSKEKVILLNNLREIIDECGQQNLKNTMLFYAVPDMSWLEGKKQIYAALVQRLKPELDADNPSGVKISLEDSDESTELLHEIGEKLYKIYSIAYGVEFDEKKVKDAIRKSIDDTEEKRYETGMKRTFVQDVVKNLNALRKNSG